MRPMPFAVALIGALLIVVASSESAQGQAYKIAVPGSQSAGTRPMGTVYDRIAGHLPPSSHPGPGWFDTPSYDVPDQSSIVRITSMVRKAMTCTVSWSGIKVGSAALGVYDTGASEQGSFTLQVPAYSGSGPAVSVQGGIRSVGITREQALCNHKDRSGGFIKQTLACAHGLPRWTRPVCDDATESLIGAYKRADAKDKQCILEWRKYQLCYGPFAYSEDPPTRPSCVAPTCRTRTQ